MNADTTGDIAALNVLRHRIEAAENAGHPEVISGLFADDAVVMVPDFEVQEGKSACSSFIRSLLPDLLAAFERRVAYTSGEVRVLSDAAFDRGTFIFTVRSKHGGRIERVTGKYLWLYERDPAGAWKWARVIMSRDEETDESESRSRSGIRRLFRHRMVRGVMPVLLGFAAFTVLRSRAVRSKSSPRRSD